MEALQSFGHFNIDGAIRLIKLKSSRAARPSIPTAGAVSAESKDRTGQWRVPMVGQGDNLRRAGQGALTARPARCGDVSLANADTVIDVVAV